MENGIFWGYGMKADPADSYIEGYSGSNILKNGQRCVMTLI
jgi:hypothetical protein